MSELPSREVMCSAHITWWVEVNKELRHPDTHYNTLFRVFEQCYTFASKGDTLFHGGTGGMEPAHHPILGPKTRKQLS